MLREKQRRDELSSLPILVWPLFDRTWRICVGESATVSFRPRKKSMLEDAVVQNHSTLAFSSQCGEVMIKPRSNPKNNG